MPDCSGSGQLSVDNQQAHSGQQSLRVEGGANYCDHIFLHFGKISELGAKFYIRFYVRLQNAFGNGHVTFLSMTDNSDSGKHFRMGGQSGVFMFNRELSDATLPVLSPTGISMSVSPASNQWYCVEFQIDEQAKALDTWINSILAAGLLIDQTPTPDIDQQWLSGSPWQPSLIDFNLGWESYGSMANTVWFDDIAISTQRIGCTP